MKKLALFVCSLAFLAITSSAWAGCAYHDKAKITMTPTTDEQQTQTTTDGKAPLIVDTQKPASPVEQAN